MITKASTYFRSIDWLAPLPIPEKYFRKAFKISTVQQLSLAFMLNILSLAVPIMMLQVYDRIIPHQSYGTLAVLITGVVVALSLDAVLRILRSWLVGWSASSNEHMANCAALDHLARADITEFERVSSGEHIQNFSALSRLREFYSGQALSALIDLPFAAIFLCLVAYLGGVLVVVPIVLLVAFCIYARFVGLSLKKALERRGESDNKKSSTTVSILSGIHSVKSLGIEAPLLRQYEHMQADVTRDSYLVALASGKAATLGTVFAQLSLIATAGFGAMLVINGSLSVGGLSACTLLAGRAIQPIQRVLGTWLRLQDLSLARKQAQHLFSLPARQLKFNPPQFGLGYAISMHKVSFGYTNDHPDLLKNISFEMKEGRSIAITGGKSSGKSTLLHLMAGLLAPKEGQVRIGDIDPSEYSLSDLAGYIGYLPQEGRIFRGTILENITGFRDDETSIRAAKEAASDLGLDHVIDLLPYGYQTMLTDTTADPVPPGIKQRIAIVRVLMHKPSILLFDDADRALDKEGYNRLFRLLGRLKGRCTMVLVSHDRNLLSFSDETYILNDGILLREESAGSQNISYLNFPKERF